MVFRSLPEGHLFRIRGYALWVMEVPLAKLVNPGVEVSAPPTVALAGLGDPLFFSWSPDSRYIVQVQPALPPAHATS